MKAKVSRKNLVSNRWLIAGLIFAGFAVWLRLWHLNSVPSGLHPLEAGFGLKAAALKIFPAAHDMQQTLTLWSIKLSGHFSDDPITKIRLAAAKFSLVGLLFFWLWLKHLYGRRAAIFGLVLAAVTPWALHLSRFGAGYSLALAFIALSLYALAKAWDKPNPIKIAGAFAITALGLYTDPVYNWYVLGLLISLPAVLPGILSRRRHAKLSQLSIGFLVFLLLAAPASLSVLRYFGNHLSGDVILHARTVAEMFLLKTPSGFEFNLSTLPLLNAFAGLMLLLGLLSVVVGLKSKANRQLLLLFLIALLPAILLPSGANLADRTAALLWPTLALSALGMEHLLGQWLKTFPQNNAARQLGILMISVLLLLTARQGYNQYFLAWPASTETKIAYHVSTVEAAKAISMDQFKGEKLFVDDPDGITVARYLHIHPIGPEDIKKLPKAQAAREYYITPAVKSIAFKSLASKQPGGKLTQKLDTRGQELYLIYTVKP